MMKPYNKHLNINSRDNALKKVHFSSLLILIATIYSSKSFSLTNLEYCPSHTYQSWDQAQTDFSRVSALEASLPDSDIKKNHVSIPNNYLHYYASMSAGYGSWRDISPTDGETGIMGLAFGAQHYTNNSISLGGELEMQSGNHMRIHST
ncbi:MAG: hypothetical protein Q8L68_06225, partial [Methylococcales bacterium]|nr:hypothetical protein [Methylococcales bacterium]